MATVGRKHWMTGWSVAKKSWCCHHVHIGCNPQHPPKITTVAPPITTTVAYNCNVDYTDCYECLQKRWSISKLAWCCQVHHRGCAPRSTSSGLKAYNCSAGVTNMETGWSSGK